MHYKTTFLNACTTRKEWGHNKMILMFCPKATVESDCDCEGLMELRECNVKFKFNQIHKDAYSNSFP